LHHHHHYNNTMPNSPAFNAQKSSNRMSPPKMHRTLSGGKQSVEDILNASSIPHPDRILPMPNYASSVPSASFSMSQPTSAHASPATSRASSPTAGGFYGHGGLAHSLHRAFGMTPANTAVQQQHLQAQQHAIQQNSRLAPMSGPDRKGSLPSFSRGGSPAFGMEVDGTA
jgi:zinc finger protein CreA/MIG